MAGILGIDNAIGWAHWRLRGGWFNIALTTFGFAAAILVLLLLFLNVDNPNGVYTGRILAGARITLLYLQAGLLTLFAGSRVAVAIRSDFSTRMMESHRLMPISPGTAVSGYIWGPSSQAMALALATFIIGAVVTLAGGMPLAVWVGPNIILFAFGVFASVVAAYSAFVGKAAWAVAATALVLFGISGGFLLALLPGMTVLCGPMVGPTVFVAGSSNYELDWPMFVSLAAQVVVGIILYHCAARKYRRSEDSALAIVPGVLLLVAWVGISVIGMVWSGEYQPDHISGELNLRSQMPLLMTSIVSAILLAAAPIANAARQRRTAELSPIVALICAGIITWLGAGLFQEFGAFPRTPMLITATVVAAFLLSLCFLLRIAYRVFTNGWVPALIWTFIAWLVPILVDMTLWLLASVDVDFNPTFVSTFSPLGMLILIWSPEAVQFQPGLIFQVSLAIFWALLFYATRRKVKQQQGFTNSDVVVEADKTGI